MFIEIQFQMRTGLKNQIQMYWSMYSCFFCIERLNFFSLIFRFMCCLLRTFVQILSLDFWLQASDRRKGQEAFGPSSTVLKNHVLHNKCVCAELRPNLRPHGLQPSRFLWPWNFPGKNKSVGCHFLLQGIFPTLGSNPHLLSLLRRLKTFTI